MTRILRHIIKSIMILLCIILMVVGVSSCNKVAQEEELSTRYGVTKEEVLDLYKEYQDWEVVEYELEKEKQIKDCFSQKNTELINVLKKHSKLLEFIEKEINSYPLGSFITYNNKIKVKPSRLDNKMDMRDRKMLTKFCELFGCSTIEISTSENLARRLLIQDNDMKNKCIRFSLTDSVKVGERYYNHELFYTETKLFTSVGTVEILPNLYSAYRGMI